jgi:hypothetical protein
MYRKQPQMFRVIKILSQVEPQIQDHLSAKQHLGLLGRLDPSDLEAAS